MRPPDAKYQLDLDKNIKKTLELFEIPKEKVHLIQSISIEDRVEEVLDIIQ